MRKRIPLGGRSKSIPGSRRSHENVVNCYLETDNDGGFIRLTRTPGFRLLSPVGDGPIRGMLTAGNYVYVVSGNEFYRLNVSPFGAISAVLKGSVSGFSGQVSMAAIGTDLPQIMALTNNTGYIYDLNADTFTEITDVSFDPDYGVTSFNQRFWLNKPGSNEFFASDVLDGLNYDPLFFASAENNPDAIKIPQSLNTEVLLFGATSIERWQDIGVSTGFTLRRVQGGTIDRGIAAARSLAKWENTLFWLADDFTVRMFSGGQMTKISDLSFEDQVTHYSTPTNAFGFFIDYPHYKCYCITFPGNDVTWCYDVVRGNWHQRDSIDTDCWRIGASASYQNMVLLGDRFNGNVYLMDNTIYTEVGSEVPMTWVTPSSHEDMAPVVYNYLELVADVGIGGISNVTAIGQILNEPVKPMIRCAVSRDGGFTYTWLSDRSMGSVGQRTKKIIWRNIGRFKRTDDPVFKFEVNGDFPVNIYSAFVDAEVGIV